MMKKNHSYKLAVIISILLHVIVLSFLFVHFSSTPKKLADSNNIIKAVVVNESMKTVQTTTQAVNKEIKTTKAVVASEKIENIEQKTLHQHKSPAQKPASPKSSPETKSIDSLQESLETPDFAEQKEIENQQKKATEEQLKQQKIVAAKKLQEKKAQEKQKRIAAAKKRREEEAKTIQQELDVEKQTTEQTAEETDENDSSQQEQNINAEQQALTTAKSEMAQGEVDKYKQKIIQAISQKWLMPEIENQQISCQLLVHLGPGGVVLSVDVLKESGDSSLDRSARTAVMKASPLPVPDVAELFDKFRSLRLTFRPQGVVAG